MALDPATLRLRYPAFAGVDDQVIAYWISDGARFVDASWPIVGDREPAQLAIAAHNMMTAGVAGLNGGDLTSLLASGVTEFQSGGREGFRAAFSPDAIKQALAGGYEATKPGQDYALLLARNKGGGMTTSPGSVCWNTGFNGFAGPLGYPAALFPC